MNPMQGMDPLTRLIYFGGMIFIHKVKGLWYWGEYLFWSALLSLWDHAPKFARRGVVLVWR